MARRRGAGARLFDLDADPFEQHELPLGELSEQIQARLQAAKAADPFGRFGGVGMDAETYERLKEMGYIR